MACPHCRDAHLVQQLGIKAAAFHTKPLQHLQAPSLRRGHACANGQQSSLFVARRSSCIQELQEPKIARPGDPTENDHLTGRCTAPISGSLVCNNTAHASGRPEVASGRGDLSLITLSSQPRQLLQPQQPRNRGHHRRVP